MSERQVAEIVAKPYGLPTIDDLDAVDVPRDVLALVPRSHCVAHHVLPLSRRGTELRLADGGPHRRRRRRPDPVPHRAQGAAGGRGRERHRAGGRGGSTARTPPRPRVGEGRGTEDRAARAAPGGHRRRGRRDRPRRARRRRAATSSRCASARRRSTSPRSPAAATTGRWSASSTASSSRRTGAAPPTSTSSRRRAGVGVRFRVDGVLADFGHLPLRLRETLTTRLKIMASLDIAERRVPQSGRMRIRIRQDDRARDLDFRVSVHADAVRREDRAAPARQGDARARHDAARLRGGVAAALSGGDRAAARDRARHRSHGLGQDEHALLGALEPQPARREHHDRGGPGRVQPAGPQPGADPRERRA